MSEYVDRYWSSRDGLKLHYRDYPGRDDLRHWSACRDLPAMPAISNRWHSGTRGNGILCLEMRGRGDSAYAKDPASYNPAQYVEDVLLLFEELGIDRYVSVGTSLGGLMTLVMAPAMRERLAGVLLNDIGPVLEPAGFERIRGYIGQGRSFPTWMHAARGLEEVHGVAFPGYTISQWLAVAKRQMTLSSKGRIVFDYDMRIAEPFLGIKLEDIPDLWPGLDALAGLPALFLRGQISDILSAETFAAMQARVPGSEAVTVPNIGHAPTFEEPEAEQAVDRLLARIA